MWPMIETGVRPVLKATQVSVSMGRQATSFNTARQSATPIQQNVRIRQPDSAYLRSIVDERAGQIRVHQNFRFASCRLIRAVGRNIMARRNQCRSWAAPLPGLIGESGVKMRLQSWAVPR